jgi:hypothetical protein
MTMSKFSILGLCAICSAFVYGSVHAGHFVADTTANGMHIQLHVMPAEPFFTKDQVAAGNAKEGMLILGGAKPLQPDAETKPNSHLVVHVFDALTDKAITNARVKMSFQTLDENGKQSGDPVDVPVVMMQAIGKGEQSTHYGNNVVLPNGPLTILLIVNGKKLRLKVTIPYESGTPMDEMHMH